MFLFNIINSQKCAPFAQEVSQNINKQLKTKFPAWAQTFLRELRNHYSENRFCTSTDSTPPPLHQRIAVAAAWQPLPLQHPAVAAAWQSLPLQNTAVAAAWLPLPLQRTAAAAALQTLERAAVAAAWQPLQVF